MKQQFILAVPLLVSAAACGYRGGPAEWPDEVSYTNRTSKTTTVTVYPAAHPVTNDWGREKPGLTKLTSSHLVIRTRGDEPPPPTGTPLDARTTERIQTALTNDQTLRNVAVDRLNLVSVDGNVTIVGTVPTIADKVEIEQKVREVRGVEAVNNEIKVWR